MRLRRARERDFGFDAAGRLCELSRADRNRRRRGQPIRNIGARSAAYATPPDVSEWHRAFAKLPADVVLTGFDHASAYAWAFTISVGGAGPFTFVAASCGRLTDATSLVVLDRRKHPHRARTLVAAAIREIRTGSSLSFAYAPYFPPRREVY